VTGVRSAAGGPVAAGQILVELRAEGVS